MKQLRYKNTLALAFYHFVSRYLLIRKKIPTLAVFFLLSCFSFSEALGQNNQSCPPVGTVPIPRISPGEENAYYNNPESAIWDSLEIGRTNASCFCSNDGFAYITFKYGTFDTASTEVYYEFEQGQNTYRFVGNPFRITDTLKNLPNGTIHAFYVRKNSSIPFRNGNTQKRAIGPRPLNIFGTKTDNPCFGDNNGKIILGTERDTNSTRGTPYPEPPYYRYKWSNGATTWQLENLPSGTYTVTLTDKNYEENNPNRVNCKAEATFTITSPPALTVAATPRDLRCNRDNTGSISVTAIGGTPNYSFLWSNNLTQQNLTNLAAGSYTVTLTDARGCSSTSSVTLSEPDSLTLTTTILRGPKCEGDRDGQISLTVSGGASPYTYSWRSNSGIVQGNSQIQGLGVGTYNVTVTDANNCTKVSVYRLVPRNAAGVLSVNLKPVSGESCVRPTLPNSIVIGADTTLRFEGEILSGQPTETAFTITPATGWTALTPLLNNRTPEVRFSRCATYTITFTGRDSCGSNAKSINVRVYKRPTVSLKNFIRKDTSKACRDLRFCGRSISFCQPDVEICSNQPFNPLNYFNVDTVCMPPNTSFRWRMCSMNRDSSIADMSAALGDTTALNPGTMPQLSAHELLCMPCLTLKTGVCKDTTVCFVFRVIPDFSIAPCELPRDTNLCSGRPLELKDNSAIADSVLWSITRSISPNTGWRFSKGDANSKSVELVFDSCGTYTITKTLRNRCATTTCSTTVRVYKKPEVSFRVTRRSNDPNCQNVNNCSPAIGNCTPDTLICAGSNLNVFALLNLPNASCLPPGTSFSWSLCSVDTNGNIQNLANAFPSPNQLNPGPLNNIPASAALCFPTVTIRQPPGFCGDTTVGFSFGVLQRLSLQACSLPSIQRVCTDSIYRFSHTDTSSVTVLWTITPSQGWRFIKGNQTSKSIEVKFDNDTCLNYTIQKEVRGRCDTVRCSTSLRVYSKPKIRLSIVRRSSPNCKSDGNDCNPSLSNCEADMSVCAGSSLNVSAILTVVNQSCLPPGTTFSWSMCSLNRNGQITNMTNAFPNPNALNPGPITNIPTHEQLCYPTLRITPPPGYCGDTTVGFVFRVNPALTQADCKIEPSSNVCLNRVLEFKDDTQIADTVTWSITPTVGWRFETGSTANSKTVRVKFESCGTFTISKRLKNACSEVTCSTSVNVFDKAKASLTFARKSNLQCRSNTGNCALSPNITCDRDTTVCQTEGFDFLKFVNLPTQRLCLPSGTTYRWSLCARNRNGSFSNLTSSFSNSQTTPANPNPGVVTNIPASVQYLFPTLEIVQPNGFCGDTSLSFVVEMIPTLLQTVCTLPQNAKTCSGTTVTYNDETPHVENIRWSVNPSTGWEFVSGNVNQRLIQIKFNQPGTYTISKSLQNRCTSNGVSCSTTVSVFSKPDLRLNNLQNVQPNQACRDIAACSALQRVCQIDSTICEGESVNLTDPQTGNFLLSNREELNPSSRYTWRLCAVLQNGQTRDSSGKFTNRNSFDPGILTGMSSSVRYYVASLTIQDPENICPDNDTTLSFVFKVKSKTTAKITLLSSAPAIPDTVVCKGNIKRFVNSSINDDSILWEVSPSGGFEFINSTNIAETLSVRFDSCESANVLKRYNVVLTSSTKCNTDRDTVSITVAEKPWVNFPGISNVCCDTVVFDPATVRFTGGCTPARRITWTFPNERDVVSFNPGIRRFTRPGTYTIKVCANNVCGDSCFSQTFTIYPCFETNAQRIPPSGRCEASRDSVNDGKIILRSNYLQPPLRTQTRLTWSNGSTVDSIIGLSSGVYTVTITHQNGCSTTLVYTLTREVFQKPTAVFSPSLDFKRKYRLPADGSGVVVTFTNLSTDNPINNPSNIVSSEWIFGDGKSQTVNGLGSVTNTYTQSGKYRPRLIVTNAVGCKDTVFAETRPGFDPLDTLTIVTIDDCADVRFPNAFLPERVQDENAVFPFPFGMNTPFADFYGLLLDTKAEIMVFDRWGLMVYHYPTVNKQPWNGCCFNACEGGSSGSATCTNGGPLIEDTYVWLLKCTNPFTGDVSNKKGTVMLLR